MHHPTSYMVFGLTNMVRPELGEHGAGCVLCGPEWGDQRVWLVGS